MCKFIYIKEKYIAYIFPLFIAQMNCTVAVCIYSSIFLFIRTTTKTVIYNFPL